MSYPKQPDPFSHLQPLHLANGYDDEGKEANLKDVNVIFPTSLNEMSTNQNLSNGNAQRQAPTAMSQQQVNNNGTTNGVGGAMNGMGVVIPTPAGQQMDVNLVFQKLVELSEVLKDNREKTQGIIAGAEELATYTEDFADWALDKKRAAAKGASPSLQEADQEIAGRQIAARIADLTLQLSREKQKTRILLREQRENTKLIGEYETEVGNIVEMIRNYSYSVNMEKVRISRNYNQLLQDEKDQHLVTRLEKDDWHAKFMRSVEMLRTAYRLRCEEDEIPTMIVAGLQNEVRSYRNALGMEPEKFEDEFGYPILKDLKNGAGEP
ncbi:MAG: hypothetical protein Q9187_002389 [Circinaria calcarea]